MKNNEFFEWIMYVFAALLFLSGMLAITDGTVGFIANTNTMGSASTLVGGILYIAVGFVMVKIKDWI